MLRFLFLRLKFKNKKKKIIYMEFDFLLVLYNYYLVFVNFFDCELVNKEFAKTWWYSFLQ